MKQNQDSLIEEDLIQALFRVMARHGLTGATVDAVSQEAGVQFDELQRRYSSLSELVWDVTEDLLNQLDNMVPEPGGDLKTGLTTLATAYWEFWKRYPAVMAFYGEAAKDSRVRDLILDKQAGTRAKMVEFFAFHRGKGCFIEELDVLNDEELEHEFVGVLLGPIFALINWQNVGIVKARFNVERHVRCFLKGYGR